MAANQNPKNYRYWKRNNEPFICTPYFGPQVTKDPLGFYIFRWENWGPCVLAVKAGAHKEPFTHFYGVSKRTGDDVILHGMDYEQFTLPVGTTNTLDTHLINVEFGQMNLDPFFQTMMLATCDAWEFVKQWEEDRWMEIRYDILCGAGIKDEAGLPKGTRLRPSPAKGDVLPPPYYVDDSSASEKKV